MDILVLSVVEKLYFIFWWLLLQLVWIVSGAGPSLNFGSVVETNLTQLIKKGGPNLFKAEHGISWSSMTSSSYLFTISQTLATSSLFRFFFYHFCQRKSFSFYMTCSFGLKRTLNFCFVLFCFFVFFFLFGVESIPQ